MSKKRFSRLLQSLTSALTMLAFAGTLHAAGPSQSDYPSPYGSAGSFQFPTPNPQAHVDAPVDQQQLLRDGRVTFDQWKPLAQVVVAGITGWLQEITLDLVPGDGPYAYGTFGDVTIEIQGVVDGHPDGKVLASQTVRKQRIRTEVVGNPYSGSVPVTPPEAPNAYEQRVVFSKPAFVTAGTPFAIVLMSTGGDTTSHGPTSPLYAKGTVPLLSLVHSPEERLTGYPQEGSPYGALPGYPTPPARVWQTVPAQDTQGHAIPGGYGLFFETRVLPGLVSAPPPTLTVRVDQHSGGAGVLIDPGAVYCNDTCVLTFPADSKVSLKAKPRKNFSFANWSGTCSGSDDSCSFQMSGYHEVTANFRLSATTLSVYVRGDGAVTVRSGSTTLVCSSSRKCEHQFPVGTTVDLTATPQGFRFWTDECLKSSGPSCTVTMDEETESVIAQFMHHSPVPEGR